MRSAIRGDFERLARRRGSQELMQEPIEAPPEPESEAPPEPEPERVPGPAAETTSPVTEEVPGAEPDAAGVGDEPARRGFFARLLGL